MEDRHHEKPPDRLQSQVPYSTSFSIIWNFSDHVFSDHLINIILIFKWWFRFKPSGKRIIIIVSPQKCNTLNRKHFPMILKSIRFRSNYTVHVKYILNQESKDKPELHGHRQSCPQTTVVCTLSADTLPTQTYYHFKNADTEQTQTFKYFKSADTQQTQTHISSD